MRTCIRISNLRLRTIIGIYDWERVKKQDVLINVKMHLSETKACTSDKIEDTTDYKSLTKQIIAHVESSSYGLIERLAQSVLEIIMENNNVRKARVRIDKPHALRFADSVSFQVKAKRAKGQHS